MYENITKEYVRTHTFKSDGIIFESVKEDKNYRIAPGTKLPPSDIEKANKLRKKIVDIILINYDANYAKIDADCFISETLLRKIAAGSRKVTRIVIAKLCVGAKLSLETAEELFMLQGHRLDVENNRLDAIVVSCINEKEGIEVFYEECEKYGLSDIIK